MLASVDFVLSLGSHTAFKLNLALAVEIALPYYTIDFDLLLFQKSGVYIVEFVICSSGISCLSYLNNSRMW